MKNLFFGVAVLLMVAGSALGQATISITGPASVAAPGDPIPIEISLVASDPALASWSGDLSGAGLSIEGFKGAAVHYNAATGWSAGGFSNSWAATETALPVNVGDFCLAVPTASPGWMFKANLFASAPGTYVVSLENYVVGDVDGTEFQGPNDSIGKLTVQVLPEPVSALLLLAGLPMLRRRR